MEGAKGVEEVSMLSNKRLGLFFNFIRGGIVSGPLCVNGSVGCT